MAAHHRKQRELRHVLDKVSSATTLIYWNQSWAGRSQSPSIVGGMAMAISKWVLLFSWCRLQQAYRASLTGPAYLLTLRERCSAHSLLFSWSCLSWVLLSIDRSDPLIPASSPSRCRPPQWRPPRYPHPCEAGLVGTGALGTLAAAKRFRLFWRAPDDPAPRNPRYRARSLATVGG
jgi:hypothetical protein